MEALAHPSSLRGEGLGVGLNCADHLSPNPSLPAERGMNFKLGHYRRLHFFSVFRLCRYNGRTCFHALHITMLASSAAIPLALFDGGDKPCHT